MEIFKQVTYANFLVLLLATAVLVTLNSFLCVIDFSSDALGMLVFGAMCAMECFFTCRLLDELDDVVRMSKWVCQCIRLKILIHISSECENCHEGLLNGLDDQHHATTWELWRLSEHQGNGFDCSSTGSKGILFSGRRDVWHELGNVYANHANVLHLDYLSDANTKAAIKLTLCAYTEWLLTI